MFNEKLMANALEFVRMEIKDIGEVVNHFTQAQNKRFNNSD